MSQKLSFTQNGGKIIKGVEYIDEHKYLPICETILKNVGNLRLVGETGVGKTKMVHKLAEILKMPLFEVVLTRDTSRWDLISTDILREGETRIRDGIILLWLKAPKGILYLDGFNYCFTKDTLINTQKAPKKISELNTNDKILGSTNQLQKILDKGTRNYSDLLYTIKAKGIYPIKCSKEHKFLVVSRKLKRKWNGKTTKRTWEISKPFWVEAKNLITYKSLDSGYNNTNQHHCLIFPKYKTEISQTKINENMAYLLGLFVADGSTTKNDKSYRGVWYLGSHETRILKKTIELLKKEAFNPSKYEHSNETEVRIHNKKFYMWVRENIGTYAHNKQIPQVIMDSTKEITKAFLEGYIDGDGSKPKGYNMVEMATVNLALALQLQKLFSKLNIFGRITRVKVKPRGKINGRTFNQKPRYDIVFSTFKTTPKQYSEDKNNFYLPITKIITQKYNGILYDIKTEDSTLQVNNIIAHNSEPNIISLVESLADFRGSIWISELQQTFKRSENHYLIISYNPSEKSGYCLKGNSLVSIPENKGYSEIKFINEDTTVLNMENKPQEVINPMVTSRKQILRIKGRGILPIECSKDHKILVVQRREHFRYRPNQYPKREWLYTTPYMAKAKNLMVYINKYPKLHNCLVFPKLKIERPTDLSQNMAYLLGLFVAEGSTTKADKKHRVTWCLGSHEKSLIQKTIEKLESEGFRVYKPIEQNNLTRIYTRSEKLYHWVRENIGKYSYEKQIPLKIMDSTKEITKAFLFGYLDGDGNYGKHGIQFKTISKTLALQLQKLFSKLDVFIRLETPKTAKTTTIKGRIVRQRQKYQGRTSQYFSKRLGLTYPKPKRKLFTTIGESKTHFFIPIRSIEKLPNNEMLYDITTEDSTLQVNNVIVSNSGTFIENIATIRRFEGLVIEYLSIPEETKLIKSKCNNDYEWARKWVEIADKSRTLYRNGQLGTPLTSGNLLNYAKLHLEGVADEIILEIASSLFKETERQTFKRIYEGAEPLEFEKKKAKKDDNY